MKSGFLYGILIIVLSGLTVNVVYAQNTTSDGDWKLQYVKLENTPQAAVMIRVGDIDNLNYGWPENFNPFSGKSTEAHNWPMEIPENDTTGYDVACVVSSYGVKETPCGGDGYSGNHLLLRDKYQTSVFPYHIPLGLSPQMKIDSVIIQVFLDDFQASEFCAKYEVTLNGKRASFMERIINGLHQSGPIGKLVSIGVPEEFLPLFAEKELVILIDDPNTGAGDGYAIDFFKILINPVKKAMSTGNIEGQLLDINTGEALANRMIEIPGFGKIKTDAKGKYAVKNVSAGLHVVEVKIDGYPEKIFNIDVEEGQTTNFNLEMSRE